MLDLVRHKEMERRKNKKERLVIQSERGIDYKLCRHDKLFSEVTSSLIGRLLPPDSSFYVTSKSYI